MWCVCVCVLGMDERGEREERVTTRILGGFSVCGVCVCVESVCVCVECVCGVCVCV